jgi:predicted nucleic acid-binding protein
MARISLDTNVLIYAVDPGAGDKNLVARQIVRASAEADGVLTQQVIGEFLNVSRKMAHLNQRRLRRIALGLCSAFPILPTPRDLLFDAFDRAARFNLQFWDAVIATVCLSQGVSHLVSEDLQDGLLVEGLKVVNPFNPRNEVLVRELLGHPTAEI